MTKPELLSPAGDLERLKIALLYGADAVYIGGTFNLRANADNFTVAEIKKATELDCYFKFAYWQKYHCVIIWE